jgi:hypothetical protein
MSKLGQQSHYKPKTHQSVAYTGTAGTITNGIGAQIQVVRIVSTSACYVAFGVSPTATTSSIYMPADKPEYFTVAPGDKVSAVQVSAGGTLHVTEMTQ